jgi:hypothetical protein
MINAHQEVFFEGGLGSQLLSFIEYQAKLKIFDGKVLANVNYFKQNRINNSRQVNRPWRLDQYGFSLEHFTRANSQTKIPEGKIARPLISEHANFILQHRIFEFSKEIDLVLPSKIENVKIQNIVLRDQEFGSIHLRRGDYRKVASHLVALSDILLLVRRQSSIVPSTMFFFTDSILSPLEKFRLKKTFREIKKTLILIEGIKHLTDIEIHGIMRQSKFLVASNSTFSFSSALLNIFQDSKIYVPSMFHKDEASVMNNVYTSIPRFNKY